MPAGRDAARLAGSTFYFTGKVCRNGHLVPRYTCNGKCVACQASRSSVWAAKNTEKRKSAWKKWYNENRQKKLTKQRARYAQDIEKSRSYYNGIWRTTPEKAAKTRARSREYRAANIEKDAIWQQNKRRRHAANIAAYNKKYKEENRPLYAAAQKRRQARQMQAMPPWVDPSDLIPFYEEARRLTVETGIKHEVDHIAPLQGKNSCGLHVPWNLRVVTKTENVRKNNKLLEDLLAPSLS